MPLPGAGSPCCLDIVTASTVNPGWLSGDEATRQQKASSGSLSSPHVSAPRTSRRL